MIVVRDIFRLKFGQAKEATRLWKECIQQLKNSGYGKGGVRLLTDLAGPCYYTLVLESTYESLAQWEEAGKAVRNNEQWGKGYEKITALTEEGRREILTVVE